MNRTQTVVTILVALTVGGVGGYFSSRELSKLADKPDDGKRSAQGKVLYWFDPMVPNQKFDKPGKSPFMDMELVPRYANDSPNDATSTGLQLSTRATQTLGLRLTNVEKSTLPTNLTLTGSIQLNERDIAIVQTRTSGFVQRVARFAPGDFIPAGAVLAEVMYPEWLAAQQEFLAIKATGDDALTRAARSRLVLLGMPETTIQSLVSGDKAQANFRITSPISGVLSELTVRTGMTLGAGTSLARINGIDTMWLELAVPQSQGSFVSTGQVVQARLPAWPGKVFNGRVTAILQSARQDSSTLRARVELPNPQHHLRAGMQAQANLTGQAQTMLTVPIDAVVRTGKRAIVYLADGNGQFSPVEVELGQEWDERIEVKRGLQMGQQVVASGQFLIDSEASLRGIVPSSSGQGNKP